MNIAMPSKTSELLSEPLLRIGILGVAKISTKTALAISNAESRCCVTAVASRSIEKVEQFISELSTVLTGDNVSSNQIVALGGPTGYDDLINSSLVDAIYIPLPTSLKKYWVIKALRAGKHVVTEKPAAMSASDLQDMFSAAHQFKKFLFDGTMFPHHVRMQKILNEYITNDTINNAKSYLGQIDRIEANFTFLADDAWMDDNIRARKENGDPHGCIGDLGWYCIRYALLVYTKLGITVVESAQVVDYQLSKHGVPIDATCVVRFQGGKVLWFHCSFKTRYRQHFEICGTRKSLIMDDLVLPVGGQNQFVLSSSGLTKYDLITFHETEVVECDVAPVQEVLLWKNFAEFARAIDRSLPSAEKDKGQSSWTGDSDSMIRQASDCATIIMMNQKVVDALMESVEKSGTAVLM